MTSASGGFVTHFAKYLFSKKFIDGVVHARALTSKIGENHFEAVLSLTADEIQKNSGSVYCPIDFSDILLSLKPNCTYLLIGTPCVISGISNLLRFKKTFQAKFIKCALVCSHSVNPQFMDYFVQTHGVDRNNPWKIKLRDKNDSMSDANNFVNSVFDSSGKVLYSDNRFRSGWTEIWRNFSFAMGACLKCPDFFGVDADVSCKDAWGKWSADPKGKSIIIVRSKELLALITKSGLNLEPVSVSEVIKSQLSTVEYKQSQFSVKTRYSIWNRRNIKNVFTQNLIVSKLTKRIYRHCGFKTTRVFIGLANRLMQNFHIINIPFIGNLTSILFYSKKIRKYPTRKILMVGGYGYLNTGDEAQCHQSLKDLEKTFPSYQIVCLTPHLQTSMDHMMSSGSLKRTSFDYASRVILFHQGRENNIYDFDNSNWRKFKFLAKAVFTLFNAYLARGCFPLLLCDSNAAKFIFEIKQSAMLYFSGGGGVFDRKYAVSAMGWCAALQDCTYF